MPSPKRRRKRIRVDNAVYAQPGAVVLLTACTDSKAPVFREPDNAEIVLSEICRLHGERWSVLGYCIMPDHVHLLVLNIDGSLVDFMRSFKGPTARLARGRVDGCCGSGVFTTTSFVATTTSRRL